LGVAQIYFSVNGPSFSPPFFFFFPPLLFLGGAVRFIFILFGRTWKRVLGFPFRLGPAASDGVISYETTVCFFFSSFPLFLLSVCGERERLHDGLIQFGPPNCCTPSFVRGGNAAHPLSWQARRLPPLLPPPSFLLSARRRADFDLRHNVLFSPSVSPGGDDDEVWLGLFASLPFPLFFFSFFEPTIARGGRRPQV